MAMGAVRTAWLAALGVLAAGCGTTGPSEGEGKVITHAEVQAAVAPTDDYDYRLWTATADDYYVAEVPAPWLRHHTLFRVTPAETTHPMSFYVVRNSESGTTLVTSVNSPGLGQVLQHEPELMRSRELPERVYELLRPQGVATELLLTDADVPARTTRQDDGWAIRFVVRDEGRRKVWTVTVPDHGVAHWTTKDASAAQGVTP